VLGSIEKNTWINALPEIFFFFTVAIQQSIPYQTSLIIFITPLHHPAQPTNQPEQPCLSTVNSRSIYLID